MQQIFSGSRFLGAAENYIRTENARGVASDGDHFISAHRWAVSYIGCLSISQEEILHYNCDTFKISNPILYPICYQIKIYSEKSIKNKKHIKQII